MTARPHSTQGYDSNAHGVSPRTAEQLFDAIDLLCRKIEKNQVGQKEILKRIDTLESAAAYDEKTGRFYLPVVIESQAGKQRRVETSRWPVVASLASSAVALIALGIVMFRDPVVTPAQMAEIGLKLQMAQQAGPTRTAWKHVPFSNQSARNDFEDITAAEENEEPPAQRMAMAPPDTAGAVSITGIEPASGMTQDMTEADAVAQEQATPAEPESEVPPPMAAVVQEPVPEEIVEVAVAKPAPVVEEPVVVAALPPPPPEPEPAVIAEIEPPKAQDPVRAVLLEDRLPVPETIAKAQPVGIAKTLTADTGLPDGVRELERRSFGGVHEAQHDLATLYASGKAVPVDYARAAYWFYQAAEGGVPNAHYNLGVMYHQGLGVATDLAQAVAWYKNAAELGHPEAMYNLGIAYVQGVGADVNVAKGISYFKRAANAGVAQAAYNLGILYESNFIGAIDKQAAAEWYEKAEKLGHAEAKDAVARLTGHGEFRNPTEVARTIEPAAGGDAVAASPVIDDAVLAANTALPFSTIVANIQSFLISKGDLPGKPDGILSQQTRDAIRAYQHETGIDVDGRPTPALLSLMQKNAKKLKLSTATTQREVLEETN